MINRRKFLATAAAMPLATVAGFQAPEPPAPAPAPLPPKPWSLPSDAVAVALAEAEAIAKADPTTLPFLRWIWLQSGAKEDFQAICDTLAKVTRNAPADTR